MKNTKQGGSSAATSSRASDGAKGQRRKHLDTYNHIEKENIDIFAAERSLRTSDSKSPLPVGYPRIPLQDITAILQQSDNIPEEGNGNDFGKPNTRGQSMRKTSSSKTTVLTEKIVRKTLSKAGTTVGKTRQKKTVLDVIAKEDISIQGGEPALLNEALRLTANLASSIQVKQRQNISYNNILEEANKEQSLLREAANREHVVKNTSESAREEVPDKNAAETREIEEQSTVQGEAVEPMEVNATPAHAAMECRDRTREGTGRKSVASGSSTTGAKLEDTRDQKRRKPLSSRSAVSRFR